MPHDYQATESDQLMPIADKLIRVVDWKWVAGIVAAIALFAINSYMNYINLQRTVTEQTVTMTRLTVRIEALTEKLSDSKAASMKQDFDILRLKDRVESLEQKQAAQSAGRSK